MEASYSSVPNIINSNKYALSSVLTLITVLSGITIIVLEIYRYRKIRNLRIDAERTYN